MSHGCFHEIDALVPVPIAEGWQVACVWYDSGTEKIETDTVQVVGWASVHKHWFSLDDPGNLDLASDDHVGWQPAWVDYREVPPQLITPSMYAEGRGPWEAVLLKPYELNPDDSPQVQEAKARIARHPEASVRRIGDSR